MITPVRTDAVYVVANHGRWVAECVRREPFYCRDALQVWRGEVAFTCPTCDAVYELVWPPEPDLIEHLLSARPDPATRNWTWAEPPEVLMIENLLHGIELTRPDGLGGSASQLLLDATGRLRLLDEPLTIDAASAPEIGA